MRLSDPKNRVTLALVLVQVLFGAHYVTSKAIVSDFPPLIWAAVRNFSATFIFLALAILLKRPKPNFNASFFKPLIILAFFGFFFNQACFLIGLKYTTSTNASILNTLIPLLTLALVSIKGHETFQRRKLVAFLLAGGGVIVLLKPENLDFSSSHFVGNLLMLLNVLSFSIFLTFSKNFIKKHDPLWVAGFMFLFGSIGISSFVPFQWHQISPDTFSITFYLLALFSIIGGTVTTYFLNLWCIARTEASRVALFIYLQPLMTAGLAVTFLGETIDSRTLVCGTVIFLGIYLAHTKRTFFFHTLLAKLGITAFSQKDIKTLDSDNAKPVDSKQKNTPENKKSA